MSKCCLRLVSVTLHGMSVSVDLSSGYISNFSDWDRLDNVIY